MPLARKTSVRALARSPSLWMQVGTVAAFGAIGWAWLQATRLSTHTTPPTAIEKSRQHAAGEAAGRSASGVPAVGGSGGPALGAAGAGTTSPAGVSGAPGGSPAPAQPAAIQVTVERNDTLDRIFHRLGLSLADLATMRALPGVREDLDRLRPGESLAIVHRGEELVSLTRRLSLAQTLAITRTDSGFASQLIANPLETRSRTITARIDHSLFEAMSAAGGHDSTTLALADIFQWDIDFLNDIQPGDTFTVTYDEVYDHGKYAQDGPILAARFVNEGREYLAVRYVSPDGHAGYYTPDGRTLRKAFLRAPLQFTRVSSPFSLHRRHPILNLIRAHKGVDYAAPTGTPVWAAGDGRVIFAGRKGGYGNVVVLDHSRGITTVYGHLSRFAHGLHVGERVSQGTVIAYVGMTGLATGPHLHYEYRINGVFKNPQTVILPEAVPIDASLREDFLAKTGRLLGSLFPPVGPALVSR